MEYIRKPRSVHSVAFTLKYPYAAKPLARPRVVISNKVEPKAVNRNKVRRRLREILRSIGQNKASFYIYVKKTALDMSFAQLKSELEKALK